MAQVELGYKNVPRCCSEDVARSEYKYFRKRCTVLNVICSWAQVFRAVRKTYDQLTVKSHLIILSVGGLTKGCFKRFWLLAKLFSLGVVWGDFRYVLSILGMFRFVQFCRRRSRSLPELFQFCFFNGSYFNRKVKNGT